MDPKSEALQVAIGSLLGDGHLKGLSKRKCESQLYVSQHQSKLSYLQWLHDKMADKFAMNNILPKKGYEQSYFMTKPNQTLGWLTRQFYVGRRKIVPLAIDELLVSPLSLAVWFMNDGTLDNRAKEHFNPMIATYNFSFDECEKLKKTMSDNFGIDCSVTRCQMRGKVYPRLYIRSKSARKFLEIVKLFIQPVFMYKVGVGSASSSGNT